MLPCDIWHVFTHPHTQHLRLHTCVRTKKDIGAVPLYACDHPVCPVLASQPDGADPSVLAAGDKYICKLCDVSDQGRGAGYLSEEEPLRWNPVGPLVFLNPATGVF